MTATPNDHHWMSQALKLANKGLYSTSPNPRVGCVIVKDEQLIGQGWHQQAGELHAERLALADAGIQAQDATAYVTLEPCSHHGRTPPCADALIDAGIKRVVGALLDPNPDVCGQGYERLRNAGIEVVEACLSDEAHALNVGFIKRMQKKRPYVRIKLAMSLDGRTAMASGESQWITDAPARADVQRLRARSCAVLTGADSVLIDNPSMTVRPDQTGLEQGTLIKAPMRVLVDGRLRVGEDATLFKQAGDIVIASCQERQQAFHRPPELGDVHHWHKSDNDHVPLDALLEYLALTHQCNEVLVETGATLAGAFIEQQLVDELVIYCAPTLLGSQARPLLNLPFEHMAQQQRWQWHDVRNVGNDLRLTLRPDH